MRVGRVDFAGTIAPAIAYKDMWVRAAVCPGAPEDADVVGLLLRREELEQALEEVDLEALRRTGYALPERDAALLLPFVGARTIVAVGLNYREHADEVEWEAPPTPLLFAKWSSALTGPFDPVPWDGSLSRQVDYEVELAAVIGRMTRDVRTEDALNHVAGYTVANDISARDIQFSESQWTRSKSFDGFCPIGPWITTADSVPDPQSLRLRCTVNDEQRQDASTAQMVHSVAELVAFASRGTTLEPGDLILTGTPSGVAMGAAQPRWLVPGDVVHTEVVGLGHLLNEVVDRTVEN